MIRNPINNEQALMPYRRVIVLYSCCLLKLGGRKNRMIQLLAAVEFELLAQLKVARINTFAIVAPLARFSSCAVSFWAFSDCWLHPQSFVFCGEFACSSTLRLS